MRRMLEELGLLFVQRNLLFVQRNR